MADVLTLPTSDEALARLLRAAQIVGNAERARALLKEQSDRRLRQRYREMAATSMSMEDDDDARPQPYTARARPAPCRGGLLRVPLARGSPVWVRGVRATARLEGPITP